MRIAPKGCRSVAAAKMVVTPGWERRGPSAPTECDPHAGLRRQPSDAGERRKAHGVFGFQARRVAAADGDEQLVVVAAVQGEPEWIRPPAPGGRKDRKPIGGDLGPRARGSGQAGEVYRQAVAQVDH